MKYTDFFNYVTIFVIFQICLNDRSTSLDKSQFWQLKVNVTFMLNDFSDKRRIEQAYKFCTISIIWVKNLMCGPNKALFYTFEALHARMSHKKCI